MWQILPALNILLNFLLLGNINMKSSCLVTIPSQKPTNQIKERVSIDRKHIGFMAYRKTDFGYHVLYCTSSPVKKQTNHAETNASMTIKLDAVSMFLDNETGCQQQCTKFKIHGKVGDLIASISF